jgi:hypothetical protein
MKYLVALDDTAWASYAFNYATRRATKKDTVYLIHVVDAGLFTGHLETFPERKLEKHSAKKEARVLVYYGKRCQELGVRPSLSFVWCFLR